MAYKPVGADENGKFPPRVEAALNATYAQFPKWATLARWHKALADRNTAPATIAVVGNSIGEGGAATTAANRWIEQLQGSLRRSFPTTGLTSAGGGVGFRPARWGTGILPTTPPAVIVGSPESNDYVGFGGRSVRMTNTGQSITWTVTGTSVDLIYTAQPTTGNINVQVDGGSIIWVDPATVPTGSETKAFRVSLGASRSHTVKVTAPDGPVYISGVMVYDGDETKGIRVIDYSQSGWRTEHHAALAQMDDDFAIIQPDLVIMCVTENDWSAQIPPSSTFRTNLETIRNAINAGAPDDPAFLVMALPQRGDYNPVPLNYGWDSYIDQQATTFGASTRGADVLDFRKRYPKPGVDNSLGIISGDLVHPGDAGNTYFSEVIANHIKPEGGDSFPAIAAQTAALALETMSATMQGRVPQIDTTPPTVTVLNNRGLDGTASAPTAPSLIPDRKTNAAGWYTSLAPTDTSAQRYFAPSAPQNDPGAAYPDAWNVGFTLGGQGLASFSHEMRVSGGQVVQYMVKQYTSAVFRLMVNGKYLTPTHVTVGGSAGDTAFITVDFGAPITVPVNLTFELSGARFYGVIHQNASTISKVLGPEPKKILWAGDSYWGSAGQVTPLTTMIKTAGWLLGYRNNVNSSIGGSGYIAPGNLGQPNLGGRVTADIVNQSPDVVVIGMGHNDTASTNAAIQTAAQSAVQAIRTGLPNAQIIVTGPMFSETTPGAYASMQASIFAGVAGISGVITVDTTTAPWITAANRTKYISTDNTHPIQIGHDYYAHRLAAAIATATRVTF